MTWAVMVLDALGILFCGWVYIASRSLNPDGRGALLIYGGLLVVNFMALLRVTF